MSEKQRFKKENNMAVTLINLKVFRKAQGHTQDALAQLAGVSTRTIQRLERGGEASFETAKSLASVLECKSYHELQGAPSANNQGEEKENGPDAITNKIKSLELDKGLPYSSDDIQRAAKAYKLIHRHPVAVFQETTRGNLADGDMSNLALTLLFLGFISTGLSFIMDLNPLQSMWLFSTLLTAVFFLPNLMVDSSLSDARCFAERIHAEKFKHLNEDDLIEKRDILKVTIGKAESGDVVALKDIAKRIYAGGMMLPKDKAKAIAVYRIAAEMGDRESAEFLLNHFKDEIGVNSTCRATGVDADQAAYESALKAKELGSVEGAKYLSRIA